MDGFVDAHVDFEPSFDAVADDHEGRFIVEWRLAETTASPYAEHAEEACCGCGCGGCLPI